MARLLLMTDFSESYANKLLKGIVRYSHDHDPWVVCKMPLSLRDSGRMDEVLKFALSWQADAIIGQFLPTDDVDSFKRNGIIAIAQDYHQKFPSISNISGDYAASGRICADYLIKKRVHNFGYFGLKGMIWSDVRRDSFIEEIRLKVPDATISIQEKDDISETWWYDLEGLRKWLRELPKPVAILACDDNRAYYIIEAARLEGGDDMRIPEDIMVLGIDNDESLCQLCSPQLSSL
ncbi:MAG: substrate-binding domain-containing protein, partial [Bacteroidales bacterium]|nr:substrate-binding domain-containing protein [Bacteroidales bacterium]